VIFQLVCSRCGELFEVDREALLLGPRDSRTCPACRAEEEGGADDDGDESTRPLRAAAVAGRRRR
jgi:hypothetical protein